jgi:hypothetical protein
VDLDEESEYGIDSIKLGTCSAGGNCVYYTGVHNIKIKVELEDSTGITTVLEQTI